MNGEIPGRIYDRKPVPGQLVNMLSARCELCGLTLHSGRVPGQIILGRGATAEEAIAIAELAEFDVLAGKMANHICESHHDHAREMMAFGHLASKVYAMSKAANNYQTNFKALRDAWRTGIVNQLSDACTDHAPAAATDSGAANADGSNEKKSETKDSI